MLSLLLISALAADEAPPLASWKVDCELDKIDDTRTCSLSNARIVPPFVVLTVGRDAPVVLPGIPDFPGRKGVRVRVDANKAVSYEPNNTKVAAKASAEVLKQMRTGKVVRFEYHQWPEGLHVDELEIGAFAEALDELLRAQKGTGEHHWPPPPAPPPRTVLEFRNRGAETLRIDGRSVRENSVEVDPGEHVLRVFFPDGSEVLVTVTAKEGVTGFVDVGALKQPQQPRQP